MDRKPNDTNSHQKSRGQNKPFPLPNGPSRDSETVLFACSYCTFKLLSEFNRPSTKSQKYVNLHKNPNEWPNDQIVSPIKSQK